MDGEWRSNRVPQTYQPPGSYLSMERAPASNLWNGRINTPPITTREIYQNNHQGTQATNFLSNGRVRAHTQSPAPVIVPQTQISTIIGEQNRSRSSSWPNKPPSMITTPENTNPVQRTRSTGNSRNKKTSEPTTPRKKRKRLNPQRRSFYKALHNDFPSIAEALREARQGNCVIDSLRNRNIFFTLIEARPPQDPTNLNVRRYNDMVFIWDPSMDSWLQVPGNGKAPESNEQDPFAIPMHFNSPPRESPSFLPSIHLSSHPTTNYFSETGGLYTYEGPFISDSSQSEDEDFSQDNRSLHDFLPSNIINDVL